MTTSDPGAVLIRADASREIGVGHVVRCRTLARELAGQGVRVAFAVGPTGDLAVEILAGEFEVSRVGAAAHDQEGTVKAAREIGARAVLVDHYGAGAEYLAALADAGLELGVIDDLADRDLSAASWVLNQNLGAESLEYRVRPDATVLAGPRYALVDRRFRETRGNLRREFRETDGRVLVTLGGGRSAAYLPGVLEALDAECERSLEVACLAGWSVPTPSLQEAAQRTRHRVEILARTDDVARHFARSDLAISGAGSTSWEMATLGLPVVVAVLAPNQARIAAEIDRRGWGESVGEWDGRESPRLAARAAETLLVEPQRRRKMSTLAMAEVDGLGATRAAESLRRLIRGG